MLHNNSNFLTHVEAPLQGVIALALHLGSWTVVRLLEWHAVAAIVQSEHCTQHSSCKLYGISCACMQEASLLLENCLCARRDADANPVS